jgi:hypothetical protein
MHNYLYLVSYYSLIKLKVIKMKNLLKLRQNKAELIAQSKNILSKAETEKRSINEAENTQLAELRTQLTAISTHIDHAQSVADEDDR